MAQGKIDPNLTLDDGLTTRQRRRLPVLAVHTGTGKGKSTAAFGMAMRAWNQGFDIGVFQFVKSAKWKVGEESVFETLGNLHSTSGQGGRVEWNKMGSGWSWSKRTTSEEDHAQDALDGWKEIRARLEREQHDMYVLDEFTYPLKWGWIDIEEVVEVFSTRPGRQHIIVTGRDAPPQLEHIADLVTNMTLVKHPMQAGRKGQPGIEW